MEEEDSFWLNDIKIILNNERLSEFIPHKDLTYNRKLNSIVRFAFYLSIILMIVKRNYLYLYIFIFSIAITYLIFTFSEDKKTSESFISDDIDNESCQLPSNNNPFMNVLLTDDTNRKQACNIENKKIKRMMKKKFNNNLFHDIEDVYDRKNSQRQFYTMPSTTTPNNRDTFQKWLYKTPKTCKEGNGNQCVANNHSPLRNSHSHFYT